MITWYLTKILGCLLIIHTGNILIKLKGSAQLAFYLSPLGFSFERFSQWQIDNESYIDVVLGAILIDWVLGTYKHLFILRDANFKDNIKGLFLKIFLVLAGGYLFEGINTIVTHDTTLKTYMVIVTRLLVFLYPAGSAFSSMSIISGGVFPPKSWMDKIHGFQKNLDPSKLGGGREERNRRQNNKNQYDNDYENEPTHRRDNPFR